MPVLVLVVPGSSKCLIPVWVQNSPRPLAKYLGVDIVYLVGSGSRFMLDLVRDPLDSPSPIGLDSILSHLWTHWSLTDSLVSSGLIG